MSKVLLHMDDKYNINGFLYLRQATMVALTVTDCIPVCLPSLNKLHTAPQTFTHNQTVFLCPLVGGSLFNHRVLLLELQSAPET